jgi:hypothetical protein
MYFLLNLLRIKGLYMFRALFSHPQEALHKRNLIYCVRVMSVGCHQDWSGTGETRNIPSVVFSAPPDNKQVMIETLNM